MISIHVSCALARVIPTYSKVKLDLGCLWVFRNVSTHVHYTGLPCPCKTESCTTLLDPRSAGQAAELYRLGRNYLKACRKLNEISMRRMRVEAVCKPASFIYTRTYGVEPLISEKPVAILGYEIFVSSQVLRAYPFGRTRRKRWLLKPKYHAPWPNVCSKPSSSCTSRWVCNDFLYDFLLAILWGTKAWDEQLFRIKKWRPLALFLGQALGGYTSRSSKRNVWFEVMYIRTYTCKIEILVCHKLPFELYINAIWGMNPRFTAGWIDEDHMGLLKKLSRKADAKGFSKGVLKLCGYRLLALRYRIEALNAQAKVRNQWIEEVAAKKFGARSMWFPPRH